MPSYQSEFHAKPSSRWFVLRVLTWLLLMAVSFQWQSPRTLIAAKIRDASGKHSYVANQTGENNSTCPLGLYPAGQGLMTQWDGRKPQLPNAPKCGKREAKNDIAAKQGKWYQ